MAKITTVSSTYERKMNLGDFNSVNIGVTLWAQLEDTDDEADVTTALRDMARNHVVTEMSRLEPKLASKVQNIIMGLPLELRTKLEVN